ncbi:MAG: DMT family transporter [Paracoccaceae bacterium]
MAIVAENRNNMIGVLSAVGAALFFSINDVSIKFLSGDYALHQVVLIRSVIGMTMLLAFIVPRYGLVALIRTDRLGAHILRSMFVVVANFGFFMALAALPLADVAAIFFVSPIMITALSVLILGEKVGPRRWLAVGVGLLGVVVMLRPGTSAFQFASLLPLAAALGYALLHIMTRRMRGTESAATMTFYVQLVFIVLSAGIGLGIGDGRFAGQGGASPEFFFREWVRPDPGDYLIFLLIGACSAAGGFLISQAYRLCEAGLAAPFEYVALPLAIFWGVTVFGQWPDAVSWLGISLIIAGGLYMFWREALSQSGSLAQGPHKDR